MHPTAGFEGRTRSGRAIPGSSRHRRDVHHHARTTLASFPTTTRSCRAHLKGLSPGVGAVSSGIVLIAPVIGGAGVVGPSVDRSEVVSRRPGAPGDLRHRRRVLRRPKGPGAHNSGERSPQGCRSGTQGCGWRRKDAETELISGRHFEGVAVPFGQVGDETPMCGRLECP
jgi:hypothetical protein